MTTTQSVAVRHASINLDSIRNRVISSLQRLVSCVMDDQGISAARWGKVTSAGCGVDLISTTLFKLLAVVRVKNARVFAETLNPTRGNKCKGDWGQRRDQYTHAKDIAPSNKERGIASHRPSWLKCKRLVQNRAPCVNRSLLRISDCSYTGKKQHKKLRFHPSLQCQARLRQVHPILEFQTELCKIECMYVPRGSEATRWIVETI